MGESKPDVLCAQACEHLSKQEYHLALCCCDEVLAVPPIPTTTSSTTTTTTTTTTTSSSSTSSSTQDHCVRLQALLYRVSALIQLKKFTEAEEDSESVMCLQELLGDGALKDILVTMLLDGRLKEICQALFNCDSVEWTNEGNMKYFRQLLLLLTESQVSSSAAGVSEEDGREGILVERRWKHRAPPRGVLGIDEYTLCLRFLQGGECALGELCISAHSHGELLEWRERLLFRRLQGQHIRSTQAPTDSYGEDLIEKWMRNPLPHAVVSSSVPGVNVDCVPGLYQAIHEKHCSVSWTLRLDCNPPRPLHRVALLSELHRALFCITGVAAGSSDGLQPYPLSQPQWEWSCDGSRQNHAAERIYQVTLRLTAPAFGSFQQTVVFDFGSEPVLLQTVSAELAPPKDAELEQRPQGVLSSGRWDSGCKQVAVVGFLPREQAPLDQSLLRSYQIPAAADQLFTRSVLDRSLTAHNYHSRLHDLLYIEENAQYMELSRFNLQTCLRLVVAPTAPGLQGSARPLLPGQLFAQMGLSGTGVTQDTAGGRLVWDTVDSVLMLPVAGLQARDPAAGTGGREQVYEAQVEACCSECMLFRLSEDCCHDLRLQPDQDLQVELQFQLNRLPLCEMHFALDSLQDCTLLFPEPPSAGVPPSLFSVEGMDARLSERQREALGVITAPLSLQLPPVLLCGPPGTGKTFTLVQATGALLREDGTRVLLCSHSEVAADSLATDLHALIGHSLSQGWLLRLQGCSRLVKTATASVQRCGVIGHSVVEFLPPGREEVNRSRVVVSTLRQAKHLIQLRLDAGCFTHILVDEASSAPECEAVMALSLAGRSTRVVLAGDPAQLPPLVYSEFARERGLQRPLLERLCGLYPQDCSCQVQLMEQYRTQLHIVRLVSELFYKAELMAGSKQPIHKDFFPLSFFVAWGTDKSSCGYLNYAEVLEVAEQVESLCKKWPVSWGKLEEGSVGVLTPYPGQALRLRAELQRRGLHCATVQTLITPPGRYFRVLFLSTVRTRHSHKQPVAGGAGAGAGSGVRRKEPVQEEGGESMEDRELGFLSSPRALRSVLLCAQSLLAVVGDPVALCTMGKCRRIWERFLSLCASEGSLHGSTLPEVLEQMDIVESRRGGVLNPLAPEFVPRGPSSPALSHRLPASLPRIMVKRSPLQHFKQPMPRERYGQMGPYVPQGGPPYLLALSSGRPCVYGKSPSPLPRLSPLSRTSLVCSPFRSRLLMPVPLSVSCPAYPNRVPVDPRVVACQTAVAYNLNLLQAPASPLSTGLAHCPRSPLQSYRSPPDSALDPGKAGRGDVSAGLGALRLWGEAEGREQVAGAFEFQRSRSPGLPDLERCSTPKLHSSRPYSSPSPPTFTHDGSTSSFRTSPEPGHPFYAGLFGRSPGQPSMQNGSYGGLKGGDEGPSRYSPWAEQSSPLLSPLLHNTQASLHPPGDTPLLSPTSDSLGYGTEDSWAFLGSFASAQAFQRVPLDQHTQSGTDLYCSTRPGPVESTAGEAMGGRRLYQRGSPSLCTPAASPLSQTDGDPGLPSSPSTWAQERESNAQEERAYPTSVPAELGGVRSSEVPLQSARACDSQTQPSDPLTLLQELGRRGDRDNSAYYSYFH
ncbi:hypothetical protein AAFF_G00080520 [Aldrovandia affinis]|uniref:AAA+ ATPase domain-containing protein n=1 Tax=Aldrovandia affinis TaxID=143900 RepID=A0AAD7T3J4_9TELE|nr:hypothetical protein AAFF_G00080520 [Aldrovandia affinis]